MKAETILLAAAPVRICRAVPEAKVRTSSRIQQLWDANVS